MSFAVLRRYAHHEVNLAHLIGGINFYGGLTFFLGTSGRFITVFVLFHRLRGTKVGGMGSFNSVVFERGSFTLRVEFLGGSFVSRLCKFAKRLFGGFGLTWGFVSRQSVVLLFVFRSRPPLLRFC